LDGKSGSDNTEAARQKVDISGEKVNVSFAGEKLRKGSFKITNWTQQDTKHDMNDTFIKVHTPNKKPIESKVKSNITCISPSDARQMLHRNTFPLRKKSVEMKKPASTMMSHRQRCQQNSFSHRTSQKSEYEEDENTLLYETATQNEIIAAITQSPDTYMRSSNSPKVSKSPPRCTFENAQKILLRESIYSGHVADTWHPGVSSSRGSSSDTSKRRVSFKD